MSNKNLARAVAKKVALTHLRMNPRKLSVVKPRGLLALWAQTWTFTNLKGDVKVLVSLGFGEYRLETYGPDATIEGTFSYRVEVPSGFFRGIIGQKRYRVTLKERKQLEQPLF